MSSTEAAINTENMVGTKEIAEWLKLSRTYVTDKLTKRPDFPRPAYKASQKVKMWDRSAIEEWMKRSVR